MTIIKPYEPITLLGGYRDTFTNVKSGLTALFNKQKRKGMSLTDRTQVGLDISILAIATIAVAGASPILLPRAAIRKIRKSRNNKKSKNKQAPAV